MRGSLIGLGLFFRLSALVLGSAFGSLLLGIWLDRTLGTAPICTLVLMVLGILVGTFSVYRTVKQANDEIAEVGDRTNTKGGN